MSLNNQRKMANTSSEFLDNLCDFLTKTEGLSQEELKEELRDEGINPEELVSKVSLLIKSKLREAKGAWKKDAHEKRSALLKVMASASYDIPKSIPELKEKIKEMLMGLNDNKINAQAYFRNLDDIVEEDLKSFYEDLLKLKFLKNQSAESKK